MSLGEFFVAFVLPTAIVLVISPLAYRLGKSGRLLWLGVLTGMIVSISIGLVVAMHVQEGWDAILYLIIILFACVPFVGGLLVGGLLGWTKRKL